MVARPRHLSLIHPALAQVHIQHTSRPTDCESYAAHRHSLARQADANVLAAAGSSYQQVSFRGPQQMNVPLSGSGLQPEYPPNRSSASMRNCV